MNKLTRIGLCAVLVAVLSAGALSVAYTHDAVTHTEQKAEAWTPTWACQMGLAFAGIGIVSSVLFPPEGVDWKFLWDKSIEYAGYYITLEECFRDLWNNYRQNASCIAYGSTYSLREDYVQMWPGNWYWHQNSWRSKPCVPNRF